MSRKPSQLCLVASHTWDTLGAVAAGCEAALIKRVGNDVLGVGPQPQIVGNDLRWRAARGCAGMPRVPRNCPIPGLISVAARVGPTLEGGHAADRSGGVGLLILMGSRAPPESDQAKFGRKRSRAPSRPA